MIRVRNRNKTPEPTTTTDVHSSWINRRRYYSWLIISLVDEQARTHHYRSRYIAGEEITGVHCFPNWGWPHRDDIYLCSVLIGIAELRRLFRARSLLTSAITQGSLAERPPVRRNNCPDQISDHSIGQSGFQLTLRQPPGSQMDGPSSLWRLKPRRQG